MREGALRESVLAPRDDGLVLGWELSHVPIPYRVPWVPLGLGEHGGYFMNLPTTGP